MGVRRISDAEREAIGVAYKAGRTLAHIGCEYGVSRERIRQILKLVGVQPEDGGTKSFIPIRIAAKQQLIESKIMLKHGMPYRKFMQILSAYGRSPLKKFLQQRNSAKKRGIGWELSFGEWWRIWEASGRWPERGVGGYVMARRGDVGPYSKRNIEICTSSQNSRDAHINKPWAERNHKGFQRFVKLSDSKVREIRSSNESSLDLAVKYQVCDSTIRGIRSRRFRKNVPDIETKGE